MCQGCVNPVVACSWLGALLVNASFVGLISWGTATFWPVGLGLAIAYTALLFVVARCLGSRDDVPSFVIDILLLLGVVGIGASGSILAFNVLGCGSPRSVGGGSGGSSLSTWSFPSAAANGSVDVLIWAAQDRWFSGSGASFAYEPVSNDLFFTGRNASTVNQVARDNALWRSPAGGPPVLVDSTLRSPQDFVLVAQHVCFVAWGPWSGPSLIHCYAPNGVISPLTFSDQFGPESLLAAEGNLYFKASAPFGSTPNEGVVYRAEPPFTTATLLSVPSDLGGFPPPPPPLAPGASPPEGCDSESGFRTMAIGMLFLATLPSLVTSVVLWWRLKAPSMSFATFCAISALAINIYAIVQPGGQNAGDFFKWWFFSFGSAYLITFITLRLQNRVDLNTFRWAIDVGCIAYVAAMHAIVEVPFSSDAWRWVVYQFTFLLPMLLIALVSASTTTGLPLVLASAAIFIDAYKLAYELTQLVADPGLKTFLMFAILGIVGLGVVGAGLAYNWNQQAIVEAVDSFAERACGPCRLRKQVAPEKPDTALTAEGVSSSSVTPSARV